ncbi:hypothetical protein PspLS_09467 [Pyricularia sp. CBS 133598]|nr:hypothetical protein PspLS_09467 [Pyricularia sp. CBS 133598]
MDKFREPVEGDAVTIHHSDAFCLKFLRRLDRGGTWEREDAMLSCGSD